MKHHILFGTRTIDFNLLYTKRKSLSIKVHPDGKVEASAPIDAKEVDVIKKIKSKAPWILKQLDQFNSFRPLTPKRRFLNGETHLYLGRQYRLKIVKADANVIKAYRGQLWIYTETSEVSALELQLQDWYKKKAATIFEELFAEILPRFRKYRIVKPKLIIRKMSKRWGSCTASGKIILNLDLIKASKGCIEYVMIHELCHLIHYSHTKPFFSLLNRLLPDWEKWKDRLERSLS